MTAINSYTEYCVLFRKKAFSTQVGGTSSNLWIDHLGEKNLKPRQSKDI